MLDFFSRRPLWGALLLVNLFALVLMGTDKLLAKMHFFRIPERVLFLPALFFGSAGAWLGMIFFRHKTKKNMFRFGFPILFVIQCVAIYFLLTTNWQT